MSTNIELREENGVRLAIEGCGHGTLHAIYASIEQACKVKGWPGVDNISTPPPEPEPVPMQVPTPKENTPEPPQAKPAARRKARNKNASLQALLANKKPEVPKSSGYGLDFMDFMK